MEDCMKTFILEVENDAVPFIVRALDYGICAHGSGSNEDRKLRQYIGPFRQAVLDVWAKAAYDHALNTEEEE